MSFSFCWLNLKGIDGLFSGVFLCCSEGQGQRDGVELVAVCGDGCGMRTTARASLRAGGEVVKARHWGWLALRTWRTQDRKANGLSFEAMVVGVVDGELSCVLYFDVREPWRLAQVAEPANHTLPEQSSFEMPAPTTSLPQTSPPRSFPHIYAALIRSTFDDALESHPSMSIESRMLDIVTVARARASPTVSETINQQSFIMRIIFEHYDDAQ